MLICLRKRVLIVAASLCFAVACSESSGRNPDGKGAEVKGSDGKGAKSTSLTSEHSMRKGDPATVVPGAYLAKRDFRAADLSGKDMRDCVLDDCDLRQAKLTGAQLLFATASGADLTGAIGLTKELVAALVFEPARPPKVDAELRPALRVLGGKSIPRLDLKTGAWQSALAHARAAASKIKISCVGAPLRQFTAKGEPDAGDPLIGFFARTRAAMRGVLAALAADEAFEVRESFGDESGGFDRISIEVDGRSRELTIDDCADIDADNEKRSFDLAAWHAFEFFARDISLVAKPHRVLVVSEKPSRFGRVRFALKRSGFVADHATPSKAFEREDWSSSDLIVVEASGAIDFEALDRACDKGCGIILCMPHDLTPEMQKPARAFAEKHGFRIGEKQVSSGTRDPMSGETSFGQNVGTILVQKASVGENAATRGARHSQTLIEMTSVRSVEAEGGLVLLKTPPYAWLGGPADKPRDPADLRSFSIAAVKGKVVILGGRCLSDRSTRMGNTNLDLVKRLVDYVFTR